MYTICTITLNIRIPLNQNNEALQKDILSKKEADWLQQVRKRIRKAIDVDNFELQEFTDSSLVAAPN